MGCHYCGKGFGRATENYNSARRVGTDRGDVHMRCLAYWFQDLGMERAFGNMSRAQREIIVSRLRLPTPSQDQEDGVVERYRGVKQAGRHVGANVPDVVHATQRLMERLERRVRRLSGNAEVVEDARRHLAEAEKLLRETAL